MQITKQIIDEFESEYPPDKLCRYSYTLNRYDGRECFYQNIRLEVWLKQREKVIAQLDEVVCTDSNGDQMIFVEDLPDWIKREIAKEKESD